MDSRFAERPDQDASRSEPGDAEGERLAAALDAAGPVAGQAESGDIGSAQDPLAAERSRFSRRLAVFGLGEAQEPLLTDVVSSFDAEGNPR
ncbi:MAG TPA: hypothetical protein VFW66_00605 [Gemmatimonadales bacterium]|nr:hypothetical protein [Gemmatimonadales bacterium]